MIPFCEIRISNALDELRKMPDESIDCVVTSPPYYGLRDYGVSGQIGLEETPAQFLAVIVEIFEEVRRVLKKDGTCWVNMGDSYAGSWGAQGRSGGNADGKHAYNKSVLSKGQINSAPKNKNTGSLNGTGLKPKELMGIPWRLAFALQDAGWWLRQDIIWSKPNPMPESVTDRCTKSHEYIFLLTKSAGYFYDSESIKEVANCGSNGSEFHTGKTGLHQLGRSQKVRPSAKKGSFSGKTEAMADSGQNAFRAVTEYRNKRSVWSVATVPCKEAHFAVYPPDLIKPCILAGCRPGGVVLDPFGGSGTTGMVALELGRSAILIELNPEYAAIAERRVNVTPGFNMGGNAA